MCSQRHGEIPHLHHPERVPIPISSLSTPLGAQHLETSRACPVSVDLANVVIGCAPFCVWLLPLTVVSRLLLCSTHWYFDLSCDGLLIYSVRYIMLAFVSTHGEYVFSHIAEIIHNAACTSMLLCGCVLNYLECGRTGIFGSCPWILAHHASNILNDRRACVDGASPGELWSLMFDTRRLTTCFPRHRTFLLSHEQCMPSRFLHPCQRVSLSDFDYRHPRGYEVVSLCGSDLHFPND